MVNSLWLYYNTKKEVLRRLQAGPPNPRACWALRLNPRKGPLVYRNWKPSSNPKLDKEIHLSYVHVPTTWGLLACCGVGRFTATGATYLAGHLPSCQDCKLLQRRRTFHRALSLLFRVALMMSFSSRWNLSSSFCSSASSTTSVGNSAERVPLKRALVYEGHLFSFHVCLTERTKPITLVGLYRVATTENGAGSPYEDLFKASGTSHVCLCSLQAHKPEYIPLASVCVCVHMYLYIIHIPIPINIMHSLRDRVSLLLPSKITKRAGCHYPPKSKPESLCLAALRSLRPGRRRGGGSAISLDDVLFEAKGYRKIYRKLSGLLRRSSIQPSWSRSPMIFDITLIYSLYTPYFIYLTLTYSLYTPYFSYFRMLVDFQSRITSCS